MNCQSAPEESATAWPNPGCAAAGAGHGPPGVADTCCAMADAPPPADAADRPREPQGLGRTTVRLPLGGLASTDPAEVRVPMLRAIWLLAGLALALAALWFLVLSVALSRIPWR